MKKLQLLATVVACAGVMTACSAQSGKGDENGAKMSKTMPTQSDKSQKIVAEGMDFQLTGIDGKTYHLSDYKGKKVYLKYWASWCPICLAGLEELDQLAKEAPEDTVILSVVSPDHKGEQSTEDFKKWYKELGYKHLPVLLDPDGTLISEQGVRVYPTSSFINEKGEFVKTQPGHLESDDILEQLANL
ncbi:redoxin domain-containing protein [Streptococcus hillyeri]|uniref:TlpA family protein disulfide reductase n=1 Tax=Streptococcus hillyeri TaxID=2282420 RepID=A0A3L9DY39_9STRE|nr:redoxin domain-containing protein [Streptococcus hillyeri]RLY05198.1 TlpA family protein disulfide reductase [Streptococcus hillyeri]